MAAWLVHGDSSSSILTIHALSPKRDLDANAQTLVILMWKSPFVGVAGDGAAAAGGAATAVAAAAPMACSGAEAPIAKEAFEKAAAGDQAGAMALLGKLDGGMGGACGSCLMSNLATPEKALPTCVGMCPSLRSIVVRMHRPHRT